METIIKVEGMMCVHCKARVEQVCKAVAGATDAVVDLQEKASMPKGSSGKNWAGEAITRVDKGRRLRAILALGSQDIGDAATLIPLDSGVQIVGCSSDHTIVDVTDSKITRKSGDTLTFKVRYANMLYAFSGDHVCIAYHHDIS